MATRGALRAAALVVVAAGLAGGACASRPTRVARAPGAAPTLRVMTYNVNYGIPGDVPTLEAIAAGRPDVVFLQETTDDWEAALRATFGAAYPHAHFRRWSGAGGIGVMSRFPLRKVELLRPEGEGWFPALRLVMDTPLGPLQALVVHLRPPVSDGGSFVTGHFIIPKIHEREIAGFSESLDPALPTLVVGDFNEEEADGKALAYLARLDELGLGMKSALPEFAPEQPTWRWPTSLHTFERRLDHVVYDRRLEPLAMEVIEAGRSDHYPVVGVFAPAPAAPRSANDVERQRPAPAQRR